MVPNTVDMEETLVADMRDPQVDTQRVDLKILDLKKVERAAVIPALDLVHRARAHPLMPTKLLMQKPKPCLKTKETYIYVRTKGGGGGGFKLKTSAL